MKKSPQKQKGFTIIEVVLVLAIAGLIFLIVFLALPQLQKSRRDTQRKSDAGRILSALDTYASNNSGAFPDETNATQMTTFKTNFVSSLVDPSKGSAYNFITTAPASLGDVQYSRGATCSGGSMSTGTGNNREIAVAIKTEVGGSYCQANK